MERTVIGILAHVDAGKTTLAEAMLYTTGKIRKLGRVDHRDTAMDTHELERERGITIFASQAVIEYNGLEITLLDTPGHVDFSTETERILQVLDYAILVISGTDGVQAHTGTLFSLLRRYNVPTFVFITKMDYARIGKDELIAGLRKELKADFIDWTSPDKDEEISLCDESLLEKYLENGELSDADAAPLIASGKIFPCFFGSGLKLEGIEEFLCALDRLTIRKTWGSEFGAKVFKISRDSQGTRLTHLKVTGGTLRVKDSIPFGDTSEKINQIRIYNGARFITADEAPAGTVCAVTGLTLTANGQGLGIEESSSLPVLEPVMNYRIGLPDGTDVTVMYRKLRELSEEDPALDITFDQGTKEIRVDLMGDVQTEILKSIIAGRFGIDVTIDKGRVMYKETISDTVEGVGHYEPLRHYAEVHLLMEPLPRGGGLEFYADCPEEILDRNWQNLVLTHLYEKNHPGVLTGSPITDMKITLVSGRSHLKHTEGGDFRQATYRAVRQGLMQAKSVLLEPYYAFRLEVPSESIGRAISDIRLRHGEMDPPEDTGGTSILTGRAPVTTIGDYAREVASYTGGRGRLSLQLSGYEECHNSEEVIGATAYDPLSDLENPTGSIFCAHGGGFDVRWDKVSEYMHLESCLKKKIPYTPQVNRRNLQLDEKELEEIMEREFGKDVHPYYRISHAPAAEAHISAPKESRIQKRWFVIDGYNVIYSWQDLKELADCDIAAAREKLMHIISNFSAFTSTECVLVFDGYRLKGNSGEKFDYQGIHVVYTQEHETADAYMQKLLAEMGKNDRVYVVTSDALIQLSGMHSGALRMSSADLEAEVAKVNDEIGILLKKQTKENFLIKDQVEAKENDK